MSCSNRLPLAVGPESTAASRGIESAGANTWLIRSLFVVRYPSASDPVLAAVDELAADPCVALHEFIQQLEVRWRGRRRVDDADGHTRDSGLQCFEQFDMTTLPSIFPSTEQMTVTSSPLLIAATAVSEANTA